MIIEKINGHNDLKKLSVAELNILSSEIRFALIKKMSKLGGHMASNQFIYSTYGSCGVNGF